MTALENHFWALGRILIRLLRIVVESIKYPLRGSPARKQGPWDVIKAPLGRQGSPHIKPTAQFGCSAVLAARCLAGLRAAFPPVLNLLSPKIQMSILDLVRLNGCVGGEISDWQPQKGFSIGKSKFLTNESKQFEVGKKQGKTLAKFSHDASLNGFEDLSMGLLCGSFWIHLAGSWNSTGKRVSTGPLRLYVIKL